MYKVTSYNTKNGASELVCICGDWVIVQAAIDRDMENYTDEYLKSLEFRVVYDSDLEVLLAKL